jgi:hypothetical protein
MSSEHRLIYRVICLCASSAAFLVAGCTQTESGSQGLDKALSASGTSKTAVFPLGGVITIDGQPPVMPSKAERLVVLLNDAAALDPSDKTRRYTIANPQGEFHFGTYSAADGVPPGQYVVSFALLSKKKSKGDLQGPDGFKNLYNDPEKNAKVPEYVINQQAPGKSDYKFDLKLAGQQEAEPGPKALTTIK